MIKDIEQAVIPACFISVDEGIAYGNYKNDVVKTHFVDVPRKMIISDHRIEVTVKNVDHYWSREGMVLSATANGVPVGIGVHPNFSVPREVVDCENFYDSIESISLVFMSRANMKTLRKSMKSQKLNRPFVQNGGLSLLTDYPFELKYTTDFNVNDAFILENGL